MKVRIINKGKIRVTLIFILLFLIALHYPKYFEINGLKPDLIFIFVLPYVVFENDKRKAAIFFIFISILRDLIDIRIIGSYTVIAILLYFIINKMRDYFYRIDLVHFLIIVVVATLIQDLLWNIGYNMGYMLVYGLNTDFELFAGLLSNTSIKIVLNAIFSIPVYYLYKKTKVLSYEK